MIQTLKTQILLKHLKLIEFYLKNLILPEIHTQLTTEGFRALLLFTTTR